MNDRAARGTVRSQAVLGAEAVIRALADGRRHSGQALAARFGLSRAAVSKRIAKLADWGLEVEAVPGRGYRLQRPLDLLDPDTLHASLSRAAAARIDRLDVFTTLDSTNRYLLEAPAPEPGAVSVCIAEHQSAGRGRRGRRWTAPLAAGLCLSAGWRFAETPPDLPAVGLAVGVAARRALRRCACVDVDLKWPNDLVWDERKLGGVLVELAGEPQGCCRVVAGIGLNVHMPDGMLAALSDWPRGAVDLRLASGGVPPRRNAVAAALIEALIEALDAFAAEGLASCREQFRAADYLRGRRVSVESASGIRNGTACGIDGRGALVLEADDGRRFAVISGDVSVRDAA